YLEQINKDSGLENQELIQLILDNIETILDSLPFFQMVTQFKSELLNFTWTNNLFYRDRFSGDVHVFARAMMCLASRDFGLSREFYNRYFAVTDQEKYISQ